VTVLTLDLGTSATKAALWADNRLVALTRAPIATRHPSPDRAEQDPENWWRSVVDACAELRAGQPDVYSSIDAVGCSATRETFACFDARLRALGPGIVWSDARAADESRDLGDPIAFRRRTGVALAPSCCAAKMAWVQRHEPGSFRDAAWFLSPRDFVLARITGRVATDPTLASRTGLYDLRGTFVGDEAVGDRLPPVVPSLEPEALAKAEELALPARAVAILGAGDRACEVVGIGATGAAPMVSWGTTANVSIPHPGPATALPDRGQVSRAALEGFVIEAGLSIAGAALDWLTSLTGWPKGELLAAAAEVPPGARGLLAFPWLYGARAPWWRPEMRGAFVGLANAHGPAELTRSVVEGVALDVERCLELLQPDAQALSLAGRGAAEPLWRIVIAGVTGRPVLRHRLDEAASVGARLLVGIARGESIGLDDLNPLVGREAPAPDLVQAYAAIKEESDRVASGFMDSPA
jgi:sugar (pentulose or hexulose) kinase